MTKVVRSLQRWAWSLVRQLPEQPYPSEHPWADRHDPSRPRG